MHFLCSSNDRRRPCTSGSTVRHHQPPLPTGDCPYRLALLPQRAGGRRCPRATPQSTCGHRAHWGRPCRQSCSQPATPIGSLTIGHHSCRDRGREQPPLQATCPQVTAPLFAAFIAKRSKNT
ncbi:hypothetical protein GW17_00048953 [Ensete ventricosum]|nr:hypothetical protein GW17_00048953 [Ensete ventricosum]